MVVTGSLDFYVQATVAYYLLLDNRLRTTSGYLGAECQEAMVSN
jgi:5'-AMP-activated protein kinase, catalytic alpha subunit